MIRDVLRGAYPKHLKCGPTYAAANSVCRPHWAGTLIFPPSVWRADQNLVVSGKRCGRCLYREFDYERELSIYGGSIAPVHYWAGVFCLRLCFYISPLTMRTEHEEHQYRQKAIRPFVTVYEPAIYPDTLLSSFRRQVRGVVA